MPQLKDGAPQDQELIARLYYKMYLIREVEEYIRKVYATDVIKSPVHLSIGEEAVSVGICDALAKDDLISNTYRNHASFIAKGGDLPGFMAELYGKKGGVAAGKAGSMHMVDMKNSIMGSSAVVGTTVPVAAGFALAMKRDAQKTGRQRVVAAMFGDGSTEEGCFSETVNFAALFKLPLLLVCENNRLAIHSKLEQRWPTEDICGRVATYGVKTYHIPNGDVFAIRETVSEALDYIRAGNGPVFIECMIYRWLEHVGVLDDHDAPYRRVDELRKWQAIDQIARLEKLLPAIKATEIKAQAMREIEAAVKFAEESPFPTTQEDLMRGVYAA